MKGKVARKKGEKRGRRKGGNEDKKVTAFHKEG